MSKAGRCNVKHECVYARFERKVQQTLGCWNWIGSKHGKGYGHFRIYRQSVKSIEKAHRAAYLMYVGEIPQGMMVLHRCDNPSCVNPKHLFLGTNDDNMKDMVSKGRSNAPRGEEQHLARLTEAAVLSIRASRQTGPELARRFNVSPQTVWYARTRRTWKHI